MSKIDNDIKYGKHFQDSTRAILDQLWNWFGGVHILVSFDFLQFFT